MRWHIDILAAQERRQALLQQNGRERLVEIVCVFPRRAKAKVLYCGSYFTANLDELQLLPKEKENTAEIGTDERPLYLSRHALEAMRAAHPDDVILRECRAVGATGLVLYQEGEE